MASLTDFSIPDEFKSQLRIVPALDMRTDEEIIEALGKFKPPNSSERNIWAFWHTGLRNMPAWSQRNVCDLARINGPSWTLRVLDANPESPNYALKYVDADILPKCFVNGTMDGPFVGQHSADMLRAAAVWKHGGVWIDAGCITLRKLDDICWSVLEDPNTPYRIAVPGMYDTCLANHFIAARKGDPFIKHWHDYFCHLWKDRTNAFGITSDPYLEFIIQHHTIDRVREAGFVFEFDAPAQVIFEYVAQIQAWNVVASIEEPGEDGFDGAEYFTKNVLFFDALTEDWPAEAQIGWSGKELYDLMGTRLDSDPMSEQYKRAYKVVWHVLTQASMQKVARAGGMGSVKRFGELLDVESTDKSAPKTFTDLLRYGAVHFEQVGRRTRCLKTEKSACIIKKSLIPSK